jgi:hypothetical protein
MKLLLTYSYKTVLTIITVPLTLFPLCLLLLVLQDAYTVNFSTFYFCRLIGKRFLAASGVHLVQINFHFRRATFSSHLKSKVDNILAKVEARRIVLNIDGTPIASRSHTHPSHTQNSCLLTSSLSLGVPVPRATQCMRSA